MIIQPKENNSWSQNPIVIIILLFFVLGPLALPMLYKSSKFSQKQKTILTILVLINTAYLIYLITQQLQQINSSLDQFQGVF